MPRKDIQALRAFAVYKDSHHLTVVFVTTVGPYLLRALNRVLP